MDETKINQTIEQAKLIRNDFRNSNLIATIVPHSYYSVPPNLTRKIAEEFNEIDTLLCIHNQESKSENNLFENKKGQLFNWLECLNASPKIWRDREQSIDIIHELENKRLMMVHNTFSDKEDIRDYYYCTCPKANLYP